MASVPTYTLADLRTAQTQAVISARLTAAMLARGLPTAAWTPTASGGPENTTIDMVAGGLATLLGAKMAQEVSARFLDLAQGDALTFLANHFYLLDRFEATKTVQNVKLTSVPTAPENSFAPGDVWVASNATGNRYVNITAIDLPAGDVSGEFGQFEAEVAGSSYSDPAGTIDTMVVAPPGVNCINAAPNDYLPARLNGNSTGQVFGDVQDPDAIDDDNNVIRSNIQSIRVRIATGGDAGTATFDYSLDGGNTYPFTGNVMPIRPSSFLIPHDDFTGARLFFSNGTTPSFIKGDVFTLILDSAIASQGRDAETDPSLRARCRARWPGLSLVPTAGLVQLWAQAASPEVHKILVDADPTTPGGIIVTLASAAGPASPAAQIAVDDYITPRLLGFKGVPAPGTLVGGAPEETVQVLSATRRQITPSGTVDVPRASVVAVQQAADKLWNAYLADLPIGGKVILAELEQALMDAGAITFSLIFLNGGNQNIQLGKTEVAVPADGTSLTANLIWRPASGTGDPVTPPAASTLAPLTFPARNEIEATLIVYLQDPDFPVTDWNSGGVVRTLLELQTEIIDELIGRADSVLPQILGQGSIDSSDGDWTAAVAFGLFGLSKILGTQWTQTVLLACTAGKGPYVFTAGTQVLLTTDNKRGIVSVGGTLSGGGTLSIDVVGESPGALRGLINRLESPLAGVSVVSSAVKIVSSVPQFGSDDETDNALIARCLARWPSLATIGTKDRVEVWARAASTEVTRIRVDADTVNPGGVIVTIAGVSGAVSGGAVTAAQAYVDARAPITDFITIQNASNLTITATANVTVPAAQLAAIQAAADATWNAYLASAQIGAVVYRSRLLQAVMDAGAIDIQVLHLNGLGIDVTLASNQVPVPDGAGLAVLCTWISV